MGKGHKKPRVKLDTKKVELGSVKAPKKEKDWSFDDIVRSKGRSYR